MTIPRDLDHVSLLATQDGHVLLQVEQDLGPGALLIPSAFDIKATGSANPVTVKAVAYQMGQPRVERDAVTPIPDGREGELRLALNYLCEGTVAVQADGTVVSTCPAGLTCVQGTCQTSSVPVTSLPTYDAGAGGAGGTIAVTAPDGGASPGCFDVQDCFALGAAAPVDPATCTVSLPAGVDPADANVALQFPAGGSGVCGSNGCWVVFSQGTDWTVSGRTVQLPPAACTSLFAVGATVVLTTACPAKTEAQPNCGPWSSIMMPASQPGMPSSPVGQSCAGLASQTCGVCGLQTRTCTNGTWSSWSPCSGEGVCMPESSQLCGTNGTQTCGADCQWGACGCPDGQASCGGACTSLQTDFHNCGGCGNDCTTLPHTASGSVQCQGGICTYACVAGYSDCGRTGQGCAVSLSAADNCGACGAACPPSAPLCAPTTGAGGAAGGGQTGDTCATGCSALAPMLCGGSCVNITANDDNCGACGRACAGGQHCQAGGCACPAGTVFCKDQCVDPSFNTDQNCGACGVVCSADSTCNNGICVCKGAGSQPCGKCGTQTRICANGVWSAFSACTGEGTCLIGTTQACTGGSQTCDATCTWSACACQVGFQLCNGQCVPQDDAANCGACGHECPQGVACQDGKCSCPTGATVQPCGDCGTQTRICNDGTWSAWSACMGQGACASGDMQTCVTNGTKACGTTCQWSDCTCNTGYTSCTGQCVNAQTDQSNCGGCGKGCTGGTTCQAGSCKCPSNMQLCRGTCAASCPAMTSSCLDPNSNLTWAATNAGSVDYATASAICASFGGKWRLPTYAELTIWPWVSAQDSPGELATTPSPGASTCYVSLPSSPNNRSASANYIWSSTPYTGGTNNSCNSSGVWIELASIVGYKSLTGPPDGVGCSVSGGGPQLLCVQ